MFRLLNSSRFRFFWIPKTVGTSIFKVLEISLGMQKRKAISEFLSFLNKGCATFGNVSYLNLLKLRIINNKFHHSAYKFCFVRHHYERAISLFNYLSMTGHIKGIDFNKFKINLEIKKDNISKKI